MMDAGIETAKEPAVDVEQHIRKQATSNFFINLVINGVLAYLLMRGAQSLTLQGEGGYGIDLLITAFLLSFILGCIFIITHRKKRERGELPALAAPGMINWLPHNPWLAAVLLALLAMALAVPLLVAVLAALNLSILSPVAYAIVKGIWAGLLAAVLVVLAIRLGLRATSS